MLCEECRERLATVAMRNVQDEIESVTLVCVHCCYRAVTDAPPMTFILGRIK